MGAQRGDRGSSGALPKGGVQGGVYHGLLFLSGAAGLGYEIVWSRMLTVGLGHEMVGVIAVLVAFFGGLAAGAWALDRRVSESPRPDIWYAALEATIGLWGLVTMLGVPWANGWMARWIGTDPGPLRHWALAFAVPFLLLLPATAAMGATLPAMDRLVARVRDEGRVVGGLYGANTLGAVGGVTFVTFLSIPALGYRTTLLVLAGANMACAAGVLAAARGTMALKPREHGPTSASRDASGPDGAADSAPSLSIGRMRLSIALLITGLLGIGYEVLGVRVMAQVLENTVYSFAAALAVYLVGTALGGVAYQRWAARRSGPGLLVALFPATATACLLGVPVLVRARAIYEGSRSALGGGFAGSILAEMTLALLVFGVPTFLMGVTFSHLAQSARRASGGVGVALALNTIGAAAAPVLFGIVVLPAWGARTALVVVGLGYVALVVVVAEMRARSLAAMAIPILLVPALPSRLVLVEPTAGGEILEYREGVMAAVAVVSQAQGRHRGLKVNDRFVMGSTTTAFGEGRQGHIPLLLHPAPRRALFLGVGTGITLGAATAYPELRAVGVELLPEVVELLPYFAPVNGNPLEHPRVEVVAADARRYVRATGERFDVIVADLFHPARDGSGSLYTVEHFEAVRSRLAPGGLFCQWLPLYQLDVATLRVVVRSFLEVFPSAMAFIAHFNAGSPALGLVGGEAPSELATDRVEPRLGDRRLAEILTRHDLASSLSLLGTYLAGPAELAVLADGAAVNTDDVPRVTFGAPRHIYAETPETEAGITAIRAVLDATGGRSMPKLAPRGDAGFGDRLRRYLEARDLYLRGDAKRLEGEVDAAVDAYLAAVRASPDFNAAYAILLAMARGLVTSDPAGARAILQRLAEARPERDDARLLLELLPR